jgi:hypothetical protein
MDQRELLRELLNSLDGSVLGEGFSLKVSRGCLERRIPSGHQAFWLAHRTALGFKGEKVMIVEPSLGIEFSEISSLVRFIRDPQRVKDVSHRHYLINANLGLLKDEMKGFECHEIRCKVDLSRVCSTLHQDLVRIAAPIFTHFQSIEDFVKPKHGSAKLREMLRTDVLSRAAIAFFASGVDAAIATIEAQPSSFYGYGGLPGRLGTQLVVERLRDYSARTT